MRGRTAAAGAEGGPVDTGAGTLTAARNFLEGRWSLESFQVFPAGKPPVTVKGQGTVNYDAYSNLTMDVRADAESVEALKAAGIEVVNNGFSTTGRAVVDMQKKTLTYVLSKDGSIAKQTGPLGLNLPRYWEVEADKLTLDDEGRQRQAALRQRVAADEVNRRGSSPLPACGLWDAGVRPRTAVARQARPAVCH